MTDSKARARWVAPFATAVVYLYFVTFPLAASAAGPPNTIQIIKIEGNQRIESGTVLSYMLVQTGDVFDPDRLDRSLKNLYGTDLFQDVQLNRDGDTLVVRVVENPLVKRIAFEGNHKLTYDQLRPEMQLEPRTLYTPALAEADRQHILDLYVERGYYDARVDAQVIRLDQNWVDVVFQINDSSATLISRIFFVGNNAFSERRLSEVINSREERWWRFLSTSDQYDPERLNFDKELLRRFYLKSGYVDIEVRGVKSELSPDRRSYFLTFTISEGERYRVSKITINSQIHNLSPDDLRGKLLFDEGDWYDGDAVGRSADAMEQAARTRGYAFVDVKPRMTRDRKKHFVDLTYDVGEGPRVYIERIDIIGNIRTDDKVIRRQFRLQGGEAFNAESVSSSRQRLMDLNYFKSVDVIPSPGSVPDKAILTVKINEKPTASLYASVHLDAHGAPSIDLTFRELNFAGKGQSIIADVDFTRGGTKGEISFTEPYLADRNLRGKWGIQFTTGSSERLITLFAGFQLTLWAGVLVFPMPLLLLLLLQGAYLSYLWSEDQARCRRHFKKTMEACKALILLQIVYFAVAQLQTYVTNHISGEAKYASYFVSER